MDLKYKVWVETENIGNKKLVYLFVSHKGSSSTGIRIEDPIFEIPLIVDALQRHLTSAMHSDGQGSRSCEICGRKDDNHLFDKKHQ